MELNKLKDQDDLPQKNPEQNKSSIDRSIAENISLNDESSQAGKEKYIRDSGKIEDLRGTGGEPVDENSKHLTDKSGEEKDEEYINTDERQKDLDQSEKKRNS